jgi:hypothetical protein
MQESPFCFHNLEWPEPGARISGPVLWLRGWIVAKPGCDIIDVRVRHDQRTCLGILGLPRVDLADHFKSDREWLPAEFILGVPVTDGEAVFKLEAMDANGAWQTLRELRFTIAPDGTPPPRIEGRLEASGENIHTVRDAHHPFHGHLDQPTAQPALNHGRAPIFGWLLDETGPLKHVAATTDGLVFNYLTHSLADAALAARVTHPGAGQARLRGAVDFPATLDAPVCLRVYAVRPDESVHLCFARRISPPSCVSAHPPVVAPPPRLTPRSLAVFPSGRPRRLLMVLRSLQPDDSSLRALDLARSFRVDKHWAVRIVSTEDGPLRAAFEQADAESLIVSPEALLTASDEPSAHRALDHLRRQIWWGHLDAVTVFNPLCGWAATLARAQGIPVLFDCLEDEPIRPDPTASDAVRNLLQAGWREADCVCYGSHAAVKAQPGAFPGIPGEIVPLWHTPGIMIEPSVTNLRRASAPLRTADWLRRNHPEIFARWEFSQGPAPVNITERLQVLDDSLNSGLLAHCADWNVTGFELVLGPIFGRGPLRPLLDAAAQGTPFAAPDTPTTRELFATCRLPLVSVDNPLALAHMLIEYDSNPALFARETAFARDQIHAHHNPGQLLPRWQSLLATVAAAKG